MRYSRFTICAALALMIAVPASADVGVFSSFSTTVTPAGPGRLDIDVLLTTTGISPTYASDYVRMGVLLGPAAGTVYTCTTMVFNYWETNYSYYYPLRGSGGNQFSHTFSVSGLGSSDTKWVAFAQYIGGSPGSTAYSSLYNYLLSWMTNTGCSIIVSNVDSGSFGITASDDGGVIRMMAEAGRQQVDQPIPTLGTWGLLMLGAVLAAAGVVMLRRI